ncbi:hypothetical protein KUTeg_018893 [Tegillarca granosa]|uniref:Cytochrome P450 n=1 Tax=Tegillarca granosa TaxID=220873 RepID=A0ABQ9EAZ1_TEGGR|nr:hypothetical protein KUTeg_018893 [Tegillarca granosa]
MEMKSKYGKIAKQRVGRSWMIFLFDPDDIQQVCRSDSRNEYRPELPLMTCYAKEKGIETGLAFKNGEEWHTLRKIIQEKLLKPKSVVKYIPMIEEIADEFVDTVGPNQVMDDTFTTMSRFTAECRKKYQKY